MAETSGPAAKDIEEDPRERLVPANSQTMTMASLALLAQEFSENCPSFHGLAGRSPSMRQLMSRMQRMARHLTLATIEGEEGTGRTLAAGALHAAGPVAEGPFVPCLSVEFFAAPEDGGRPAWSVELLRKAHRGTLFLDRVHQLSVEQQETLARFLHWFDDRHYRAGQDALAADREGLSSETDLPSQLLFSTSVPLWQTQSPAAFRVDLASRLCAVRFRLPPLRERREDIPLLTQIFIQRFSRSCGKPVRGLGPGAIAPLLRYCWPGNVRELENVVATAALETESQWIRPIDLPPLSSERRRDLPDSIGGVAAEIDLNLDLAIRNHVGRVLERARGNKFHAAQLLGISRSTLYRILAKDKSPL